LFPAVEPVPAGMDAADRLVVMPDRGHRVEVAGLERAIEGEVRLGHGGRFGRHGAYLIPASRAIAARTRSIQRPATTRANVSRSTLPPETSATTRVPGSIGTFPARIAAVAAAPAPSA